MHHIPLRAWSARAQSCVQLGLTSSKDGDTTSPMCSLFLCLTTLTVKEFHLKWGFLYFYLFSKPFVHPLGTKEKSLALPLLCPNETGLSIPGIGFVPPQGQKDFELPLLNFKRFLSLNFSSLLKSENEQIKQYQSP